MSMAVKYAMAKRARKMADSGMTERCEHGETDCEMCHGGMMADGGEVRSEEMDEHLEKESEMGEDMIDRIMRKKYSKGGRVANETPITADLEDNEFDDLAKRDDLEFSYTGANSGDELGDEKEDEDRRDVVSRIMRSRAKKDRMPRPA